MVDIRLYDAIQAKDINQIKALAEEFKLRFLMTKNPTYKTLIRTADRAIITLIRKNR